MSPVHVLIVGSTYQDHVLDVPNYPQEDQKLRAVGYCIRRGGNGANTACVLGGSLQQHHRYAAVRTNTLPRVYTHFFGTFPSHEASKWALDDLSEHGVDFDGSVFIEDSSVHFPVAYVIQSVATRSRTIVNYRDLPGYTASQLSHRLMDSTTPFQWIHFEGNYVEAAQESIEFVRGKQQSDDDRLPIISVEVEKPQRPDIERLIGLGDVVFFSRSFATAHGEFDRPEQFLCSEYLSSKLRPGAIAFVTWGDQGAAVRYSNLDGINDANSSIIIQHCPATKVTVQETTGAGDTFIAAIIQAHFLYDLWSHPVEGLKFACYIAGLKCAQRGFKNIPFQTEEKF